MYDIRSMFMEDEEFCSNLEDFLASMGMQEGVLLGEGIHGYVCRLDDRTVIKVTSQPEEAAAFMIMMGMGRRNDMALVHAVSCLNVGVYGIVREDAADMSLDGIIGLAEFNRAFDGLNWCFDDRDDLWRKWYAWVADMVQARPESRHLLEGVARAMDLLAGMAIIPGDMCLDNMGILASGYPVLRDLGACDVPPAMLDAVRRMRPGDVTYPPGRETALHR